MVALPIALAGVKRNRLRVPLPFRFVARKCGAAYHLKPGAGTPAPTPRAQGFALENPVNAIFTTNSPLYPSKVVV
jgi:hypothetical protein